MRKKFTILIAAAFMLLATTGTMWGQNSYQLYSGTIVEGDYIIYYNGYAMKNVINSNRLSYETVTPSNNIITPTTTSIEENIVWHIAPSDSTGYWTIYNAAVSKYAAGNGTKNQAALVPNGTGNDPQWSVTGSLTYEFVNKRNAAANVNKTLRNNGTNGFACYSTQTGGALSLYKLVETNNPSITASNVNIAYNATQGSIGYTLNNATGNVEAEVTSGDWLTLGTVTASAVPFTCSANTNTTSTRTATITLSYTGAQDKVVTVTQGKAPNNISDITANNTNYTVVGTVVATNSRGFVIGDGTGYVYYYKGSDAGKTVGDMVSITGSTGTYGHILQFTNSATVTASETSNYNNTPAIAVLDARGMAAYNKDYQLSDYVQFEGTLSTSTSSNNTFYNIAVVIPNDTTTNARISYPTSAQIEALGDLVGETVRVKGYFSGFSSSYFTVMLESVEEVTNPTITTSSNSLTGFTYVEGNGPSAAQTVSVSGSNLTANIGLSLGDNSNFEMCLTENGTYTNSLTLTQSEGTVSATNIYVRLKSGLSKAPNYAGTITLTSTGAANKTVSLSGSVTGQTYAIEQYSTPATAHGTITFEPASPVEEGTEVTLTATPVDGYVFTADSWVFYNASTLDPVVLTVTNGNKITMPAYNLAVDGTFAAKPTYAITQVVTPENSGTIATDEEAWEGKTVTVLVEAASAYTFSNIVISKTGEPETTIAISGNLTNGFTFTMPGYAVTATANFVSNTYEGSFVKYSGDITEGDYLIVYDDDAMNDTISSNKLQFNEVSESSENIITNPSRNNVWHIANISQTSYWTICNAKTGKYVAGTSSKNQADLIEEVTDLAKWTVSETSGTYDFENYGRSQASSDSGNKWLRKNGSYGYACYASGTGGKLTLYKYTALNECTITFNGNGGAFNTATTYTQVVYDGVEATLEANKFTRDGYEFVAWNNQADGNGAKTYDDGDNITVTGGDLTLYAQWTPLYTLTIDNSIDGGSVSVVGNVSSAIEGTEISLSCAPTAGHAFSEWNVYKTGEPTTKVTVTNNTFNMPGYNVTISATFSEIQTYSLVTNVNNLVSGQHFIIASGSNGSIKAMGAQNTSYRKVESVNSSNGVIPQTDDVVEFVIIGPDVDGYYTIYDSTYNNYTGGYLYASSNTDNELKTQATNDNNGRWSISIDNNTGAATINAQGANSHNRMRFNSTRFACYGSNTSVNDLPYLYAKDNEATVSTVPSKEITRYTGKKDHYYLIAPPVGQVVPADNGFLVNDYDLYAFDQSQNGAEWRNYEAKSFNLISGRGYLYANSGDNGNNVTITFNGYPYVGNGDVVLDSVPGKQFAGWNLIGNPFSTNATLNMPFYRMNSTGDGFVGETEGTEVNAMEGVFVKGQANQTARFTAQTRGRTQTGIAKANLNVIGSHGTVVDNAIVRFDNGETLEKFYFGSPSANIYVSQNGKDYAIVRAEAQGEMPVNFKAAENGTYTIDFSMENVEFDYLHLIDNMTGENVNLLVTPSYTFEARTTDYASRFRLVFSANANDSQDDNFAFMSDGNIVIVNEGEATLQMIDMLGRVVSSQSVNGNASVEAVNVPGVYVLRLINGNNVKTQRIVVR